MTITCTSTVRHGDTRLTVTGTGVTREEALTAAVAATNIGYRPHPDNVRGALELVLRYHNGERPSASFVKSTNGHATMSLDHDGHPIIQIGWVDFTFTTEVRMWAVQAQVSTFLEREGWSLSRQVPTFYLDPSVQGITGPEGARAVAEDILHTMAGDDEGVRLHVTVEPTY
jgi:hypothetical protein